MQETLERWLNREAVAKRLCTQPHRLPRLVAEGRLPQPSMHLGPRSPRWDIHAIDAMMLEQSGVSFSPSTEDAVAKACEEIATTSRRIQDRQKDSIRRHY